MFSTKFVLSALILMSFVMSSFSYFSIVPSSVGKSKDHEGFCFFNDTLIKKGESIITEQCEELACLTDYSISIAGCGTYHLEDPSCKTWKRDFSKPYPECCNSFICIEKIKKGVDFVGSDKNTLD